MRLDTWKIVTYTVTPAVTLVSCYIKKKNVLKGTYFKKKNKTIKNKHWFSPNIDSFQSYDH